MRRGGASSRPHLLPIHPDAGIQNTDPVFAREVSDRHFNRERCGFSTQSCILDGIDGVLNRLREDIVIAVVALKNTRYRSSSVLGVDRP